MGDLARRAYPLLAAWNCELVRLGTRESTRKPIKQWLLDAEAMMKEPTDGR